MLVLLIKIGSIFYLQKNTLTYNHKVKGKRYTGEIIYLKSSKEINLKEKSFLEISYYKNSKIIYNINLEKE
jgi:hypothetical protein